MRELPTSPWHARDPTALVSPVLPTPVLPTPVPPTDRAALELAPAS